MGYTAQVRVAPGRKTAIIGAGCVLKDAAEILAANGLALFSAVEIGNLTMGAAACCHTKNRHLPGERGALSSYVVGTVFVDGRGRVHRVRSSEAAVAVGGAEYYTVDGAPSDRCPKQLMRHARSSHGLLGVVVEVEVAVRAVAGRSIDHMTFSRGSDFAAFAAARRAPSVDASRLCVAFKLRSRTDDPRRRRGVAATTHFQRVDDSRRRGVAATAPARRRSLFAYVSPSLDRYLVEMQRATPAPPRESWFWGVRERLIVSVFPLFFRFGDALPSGAARRFYAALHLVGEFALRILHKHPSAPPGAHIGWHDHTSTTKFQWTFLALPLEKAERVFAELRKFCAAYEARTGYSNAYFVSYVMDQDALATFSYAATGPVVTIDPIAANSCDRFLPFCRALATHLESTVGGLKGAFNQSIGVPPRTLGVAVSGHAGANDFVVLRRKLDPDDRFLNPYFTELLQGVAGHSH